MSAETTPMDRAFKALVSRSLYDTNTTLTRKVLTAALDDPELANRIRDWRLARCEHSRPLRYGPDLSRPEPEYEQACSPCLRDRMVAYLLDGAS